MVINLCGSADPVVLQTLDKQNLVTLYDHADSCPIYINMGDVGERLSRKKA